MIKTVRIRNFKAIRDSRAIRFSDLSVFIGNNGSGKSSVFEALQLLQQAVTSDLTEAFERWGGLENVRHYGAAYGRMLTTDTAYTKEFAPITIDLTCRIDKQNYRYEVAFNTTRERDFYVVESESLYVDKREIFSAQLQNNHGFADVSFALSQTETVLQSQAKADVVRPTELRYTANKLFISGFTLQLPDECQRFQAYVTDWQFLALNAHVMGLPTGVTRTLTDHLPLDPEGRNIAEYIRRIASDPIQFDALVDKMRFVLPYASDIQTHTTEDFDRKIQLRLYEVGLSTPIPGWLFSSGTLRVLALLAVLNNNRLPTVLFIDEIENGLDPRTIGLLTEEIRRVVLQQKLQVIATTHSPYFLDLVDLKHIIVTERQGEKLVFIRPEGDESLTVWKARFSPGKLYTMGRLTT